MLGSTKWYHMNSMHSVLFCVLIGHKTKRNAKKVGGRLATWRCIPCGMRVVAKLIIVKNDIIEKIEPHFIVGYYSNSS